jgi:hypothetical protein
MTSPIEVGVLALVAAICLLAMRYLLQTAVGRVFGFALVAVACTLQAFAGARHWPSSAPTSAVWNTDVETLLCADWYAVRPAGYAWDTQQLLARLAKDVRPTYGAPVVVKRHANAHFLKANVHWLRHWHSDTDLAYLRAELFCNTCVPAETFALLRAHALDVGATTTAFYLAVRPTTTAATTTFATTDSAHPKEEEEERALLNHEL